MELYFVFSLLLILLYVWLIFRIYHSWDSFELPSVKSKADKTQIAVVVIARNEAANIAACLSSIAANTYPSDSYEIILVDDHSDDETIAIARSLRIPNLRILELQQFLGGRKINSYKKNALDYAAQTTDQEWIVCTDADCIVPPNWLSIIDQHIGHSDDFIAMPLMIMADESQLSRFQTLDMTASCALTLFGIRKQGFYLANGANMAFRKSAYANIDDLNNEFASGDDVFLIRALAANNPSGIQYLKHPNSIVRTQPEGTISDLIRQRRRWATKAKAYFWSEINLISVLVFLVHLSLAANIFLALLVDLSFSIVFIFQLFLKLTIDYLFLSRLAKFFKTQDSMKAFLVASVLNIPYYILMGLAAIFGGKYDWKGRKVR